jgi:hypothetical protein
MSIVEDSIQEWFMRFVVMAIPRTEVVLHRILRGQKRLSAGAADVTGERTILLLAAYSSHSSSFRKSLLLIAVK